MFITGRDPSIDYIIGVFTAGKELLGSLLLEIKAKS